MITDFNNRKNNTISQKIRKITVLKKYILDTIDESQEIKRLVRYLTKTPLAKKGLGYDDSLIIQSDLKETLMKDCSEGEMCLYSGLFDPKMESISKNYIFVHHLKSRISDDMTTMNFYIHILVSDKYNELKNYGDERNYQIADYIVQLLDEHTIENDEIVDIVGNVKFSVVGDIVEERMSKTKDIILLSIPVVVKSSVLRCYE